MTYKTTNTNQTLKNFWAQKLSWARYKAFFYETKGREVNGGNLSPETGYLNCLFMIPLADGRVSMPANMHCGVGTVLYLFLWWWRGMVFTGLSVLCRTCNRIMYTWLHLCTTIKSLPYNLFSCSFFSSPKHYLILLNTI